MKQWKCTVCGHLHEGDMPPATCPICGVSVEMFTLQEDEEEREKDPAPAAEVSLSGDEKGLVGDKRWKCTVCGYIHEGEDAPEKCPLCGAAKSMFILVSAEKSADPELPADADSRQENVPDEAGVATSFPPPFGFFGRQIVNNHLHPIAVHTPNGVLPLALVFLLCSMLFRYKPLEQAAFFSLIFTLLSLPAVIFTGVVAWKIKFKGVMTPVFRIKIICAIILFFVLLVMVIWRAVASESASGQSVYLFLCLVAVALAGIAGHLGGKLVFTR